MIVTYTHADGVATITMDDGKVNALSPAMQAEINAALDQAEVDDAVVVLSGREGVFSAGFDLKVLRGGGPDAVGMLKGGFSLAERMLTFPKPLVIACPGHAIAMGVFLLMCGDYRIGASGPFRVTANEVAIGLTMPRAALEICRQRLTPAAYHRAMIVADVFSPEEALVAGFVDRLAAPEDLASTAQDVARQFAGLDMAAHAATKQRARADSLARIRAAIEADNAELG